MCGITGIYSPGTRIDQSVLLAMTQTLYHRGPDDSGLFIDTQSDVGLGHTRLSIIDLSEKGKQPMSNSAGTITASYNGEIYNYREIRKELEQNGHSFVSDSDTEVVVKSYEEWGMDCLHRFIGMFSLAIWDARKKTLFLARDRVGVKPLYYYKKNGLFLFASELKSMMKHPSFTKQISSYGLSMFLKYDYTISPYTIFENTFKLEPGHWMSVKNGKIEKCRYWNITDYYNMPAHSASEEEIISELEKILVDSFKYRLVSDVPVGLFLSGGIDSSIVAALLQKNVSKPIKTFTIGFNEKTHDEAGNAREVAGYLGTDHTEKYISENDALDIVPKLPEIFDEPFADNSAIPVCYVAELARQKVKVALSADGGDELFCGYGHYASCLKLFSKVERIPGMSKKILRFLIGIINESVFDKFRTNIRPLERKRYPRRYTQIAHLINKEPAGMYNSARSRFTENELQKLLPSYRACSLENTYDEYFSPNANERANRDFVNNMLLTDFSIPLTESILTKVDRATMRVALESREPFLDHRVIEFVARIPHEYKYRNGESKYILKKVLEKHLPRKLFDRPKVGFNPPNKLWLKGKLKSLVNEYCNESAIKKDGYLNPKAVSFFLKEYYKHSAPESKVWSLLIFQLWKEKHL